MARVHPRFFPKLRTGLAAALFASCLGVGSGAVAQRADDQAVPDVSSSSEEPGDQAAGAEAQPDADERRLLGDEQALQEERAPNETFRETTDPHEDPDKTYWFFGAGWRFSRVPTWMLGAYHMQAGPAVSTPASFSGELAYRKNGFQVLGTLNFTKLKLNGPFQLKGDPIEDTEWMQANFKLLNLMAAITWSTAFTDWFQVEYGVEAGLGFLFGELTRSEAYQRANGTWGKCPTWASQTTNMNDLVNYNPNWHNPDPGANAPTAQQRRFCDQPVGPKNQMPPDTNTASMKGAQYGVHAVHGLFNGGVPHVIPILGPRLSLRFKPIRQVVLRVDVPLPMVPFGFMGGASAQYGF
jgi:hypothetical protein